MPKAIATANTGNRGPQIINQSADRTMKCYLITEVELRALTRNDTRTAFCFSVAAAAITLGVDALRSANTGTPASLPWAIASGVVAAPFLVFGIVGLFDRQGILKELRKSGQDGK